MLSTRTDSSHLEQAFRKFAVNILATRYRSFDFENVLLTAAPSPASQLASTDRTNIRSFYPTEMDQINVKRFASYLISRLSGPLTPWIKAFTEISHLSDPLALSYLALHSITSRLLSLMFDLLGPSSVKALE